MTPRPLILALPGNERLAAGLAAELDADLGAMTVRRFPDGESYVRLETPVAGREVALACTLNDPDPKLSPLLFAASTARELGAARVGLVAPYLAYMRQDKRFHDGECITSKHFAALLSRHVDWLVTVDPHLHRRVSLDEIYPIPSAAVAAAPLLAEWIGANVRAPVLIGPDSESEQWVAEVARGTGAPFLVLDKVRRGDRNVTVSVPDAAALGSRTPVLVDDIVSTARTMISACRALAGRGAGAPVCVGVHAIFAGDAHAELLAAGARRIVTTNTIEHASNGIDVHAIVAAGVGSALSWQGKRPA
jgi:ribose-phosphate pyrophosphokinase